MQHWLEKITSILTAETSDLRRLAQIAGGDPKVFYRGASMDGVDVTGQDLRGMEFTNLDKALVKLDVHTRFAEEKAASIEETNRERKEWVTAELYVPKTPLSFLTLKFDDPHWVAYWHALWRDARAGSADEVELVDFGIQWLEQVHSTHTDWASIWGELWKFGPRSKAESLAALALRWLRNYNEPTVWSMLWRKVSKGLSDTQVTRELIRLAMNWLNATDTNFTGWAPVWRSLRSHFKILDEDLSEWLELGFRWLKNVGPEHLAWVSIWRELLRHEDYRDRCLLLGEQWLSFGGQKHHRWAYAWYKLWTIRKESSESRANLFPIGVFWIRDNPPQTQDWALVWNGLWSASVEESVRIELVSIYLDWLQFSNSSFPSLKTVLGLALLRSHDQLDSTPMLMAHIFRWLESNYNHNGWAVIWLAVWPHLATKVDLKKHALVIAIRWVGRGKLSARLLQVWLALWIDGDNREFLLQQAERWSAHRNQLLHTHIWKKFLEALESEPQARELLRRLHPVEKME